MGDLKQAQAAGPEEENRRLKKLLAESMLELRLKEMLGRFKVLARGDGL
jgi:hypothetical protein